MKSIRQPLIDSLLLCLLWSVVLVARAQLNAYWPFDLLPNTQVLQPVSAQNSAWMGLVMLPAWTLTLWATGSWRHRAPIQTLGTAIPVATLVSLAVFELLRITPVSRTLLLGFAIASLLLLAAVRWRPHGAHRVLLVGKPEDLAPWREVVVAHPSWGIEVIGPALPSDSADIRDVAREHRAHEIYAAGPISETALQRLSAIAAERDMTLSVDANFLDHAYSRAHLAQVGSRTLITFASPPNAPAARAAKRTLDLLFASLLLVLISPLLLLAAMAVRLQDGGPALFVQERVGQHGRRFPMFKLRSMIPDAAAQRLDLSSDVPGPVFKLNDDPRVTAVGKFLRRTSIDELPQLVNVLRGEMSLVGPRPPLASEVQQYAPWQLRRLSVPPGITGLWQVSGRSNVDFERWMTLDLHYVDHWSIWLDIRLLLRTVPAVIRGTGAR